MTNGNRGWIALNHGPGVASANWREIAPHARTSCAGVNIDRYPAR